MTEVRPTAPRFGCTRDGGDRFERRRAWCWRPTSPACSASSTPHPASATTTGGRGSPRCGTAPPFVVQRLWLDRPVNAGPRGVPRDGRATAAGQCQRAGALRAGGAQLVAPHRRLRGRTALLRRHATADDRARPPAEPGCTSSTRRPRTRGIVDERVLCRSDCPRFAPGDFAGRPTVATPHRRSCSGRRRYPHRPAGGVDGARRHDRLVGGQPAAERTSGWPDTPCTPCPPRAGPALLRGSRAGEAAAR